MSTQFRCGALGATALTLLSIQGAFAHASLGVPQGSANSSYRGHDAHALKEPAPSVKLAAAQPAPAAAATIVAGSLTIASPWLRATPGGAKVGGGYLRIINTGKDPDRLVSASIPQAGRGEVHAMTQEGGVAKMAPVEGGLVIPPGGTVELKPSGYHLMFMDLAAGLKEGESVRGVLVFEKAGRVEVNFPVGGVGASGPGMAGHQH